MAIFRRKSKVKGDEGKVEKKIMEVEKKLGSKNIDASESAGRKSTSRRHTDNSLFYGVKTNGLQISHAEDRTTSATSQPSSPAGPRCHQKPQKHYEAEAAIEAQSERNGNQSVESEEYKSTKTHQCTTLDANGTVRNRVDRCNPNYSSDSGYESAGPATGMHSRGPSDQNPTDHARGTANGYVLPELRLGDGSKHVSPEFLHSRASEDHVRNVSPLDLNADTRSVRSARSNRSTASGGRRNRYDERPDPMPSIAQLEQCRGEKGKGPLHAAPKHNFTSEQTGERRDEPGRVRQTNRLDALQPMAMISNTDAPVIPPLEILAGFKVNKRGRILDEEGECIGELFEGDLLDCVRQRANAKGEVLDEYGRVVGLVRTITPASRGSLTQPMNNTQAPDGDPPTSPGSTRATGEPGDVKIESAGASLSLPAVKSSTVPDLGISLRDFGAVYKNPSQTMTHGTSVRSPQPSGSNVDASVVETKSKSGETNSYFLSSPTAGPQAPSSSSPDFPKRPVRNASDRSLSDLSKTYVRPVMSSVPENNVPEDDEVPASPTLFAYKGDIPTAEQMRQAARAQARSPLVPPSSPYALPGPFNYMKASIANGQANNGLLGSTRPTGMESRRATTQYTSSSASSTLSGKQSLNPAVKKSISAGFDHSPNASDAGTEPSSSEDGRPHMPNGHSFTDPPKRRTYFTHAGRVAAEPTGSPTPDAHSADQAATPPATALAEDCADKKKSRMSFGFARKAKASA